MPGVGALLDTNHEQIMAETGPAIAWALLDVRRTSRRNMLRGVSVVIAVPGSAIGWGIDGAGRPGEHVKPPGKTERSLWPRKPI